MNRLSNHIIKSEANRQFKNDIDKICENHPMYNYKYTIKI